MVSEHARREALERPTTRVGFKICGRERFDGRNVDEVAQSAATTGRRGGGHPDDTPPQAYRVPCVPRARVWSSDVRDGPNGPP